MQKSQRFGWDGAGSTIYFFCIFLKLFFFSSQSNPNPSRFHRDISIFPNDDDDTMLVSGTSSRKTNTIYLPSDQSSYLPPRANNKHTSGGIFGNDTREVSDRNPSLIFILKTGPEKFDMKTYRRHYFFRQVRYNIR